MLPRNVSSKIFALGFLVLCLSSEFVTAGSLRSNNLFKKAGLTLECSSCDSIKECGLRDIEQRACATDSVRRGEKPTCITIYNAMGLVERRGCSEDLSKHYNDYCIENQGKCIKCDKANCDIHVSILPIDERAIDDQEIYGIFQELPLNCYTCDGDECASDSGLVGKCEGNPLQDCVTIFNENGNGVLARGCENVVETAHKNYCAEHPDLCFNCKSNGCNTISDASAYQECLYCDAATNSDCLNAPENVTSKRKCTEGCITSFYPRQSNPQVQDLIRMCGEDIEEDDREKCVRENNCVSCDGKDCNKDVFPEERLSCLHCTGEDCGEPQSKLCTGYMPNDQCYMYFDNATYTVIRSGCVSDLLPGVVEANIKQYFLCDGDNCNDYDNLPEAKVCLVCNSAENENCAIDPTKVSSQSRCQQYPYTECYLSINDDGHTQRGCLYNLPTEDFIKCKNGDPSGSNCKICAESGCNNEVYPSDRQQCHRCNSADDPSCEIQPAKVQACPIYQANDGCVTKLVRGITYRGCLSELSCDTEDSNDKNCKACDENSCNTINLSEKSIGDPGMFQDLPLNCYRCNGIEECSQPNTIWQCEGSKLQACTVSFDSDGVVNGRGCSDSLDAVCEENGNTCYSCKSNGCNDASQEKDFIDCIFCDSQDGENCTFNVSRIARRRKCYKSCMTALYPRTDDEDPVYEEIKSCLNDYDLDQRELCEAGQLESCRSCNEPNCNTVSVGQRKSCYHCQGANCQAPEMKTCRGVMANDQCFIQYDEIGAVLEMGCKSKYDPEDVKSLLYTRSFWLCDDDNCNALANVPSAQNCVICNSRTDSDCAIAPNNLNSTTNCNRQPYTQCYTRILDDGSTERGCLSNLQDNDFGNCLLGVNNTLCSICSEGNCNKQIFPVDRLSCHVCDSKISGNVCEKTPASEKLCSIYNPNDRCVTTIDSDGYTQRGCNSTLPCDESNSSKCQACDTANCNRVNLKRKSDARPGFWQDLPLKCKVCDDAEDCAAASAASSNEVQCRNKDYCMTIFNSSGAVEARGCSSTIESKFGDYCDISTESCYNCNSNNCNTARSLTDFIECVSCDSETDPDCVRNPESIGNRRKCNGACMTALYLRGSGRKDVYGMVRDCLDDKDENDRESCLKNADGNCVACSDNAACNTKALPQERWSCYTCANEEECEDSEPMLCQNYKADEQCFMQFNGNNSVVRQGCASDLDDLDLAGYLDVLYLCDDGSNCNSYANIPQPNDCIKCNSDEDPDCASNPLNIPDFETCTTLPNTQCFKRVLSDGTTERGCVGQLSRPDRMTCLYDNPADCAACTGNRCNSEIFPEDRRRCHRCNDKDDKNCKHKPQHEAVCPFYSDEEFCSTKVVDGVIYRGCSSDFQCDESDYLDCRLCKGADNCNTVNLKVINIGYPGKWQDLPLNCYKCENEECQQGLGAVGKCENDNLQNCVTVFDSNSSVVQRGCSNSVYENAEILQHCDANPANCKYCKSNGCNTAMSMDGFENCIFCDSSVDSNCVWNVTAVNRRRPCDGKCMTALYALNDDPNPAYGLTRSCDNDKDIDDREACSNGNDPLCKVCVGDLCNAIALPETRLKCYRCNGDDCTSPKSQECLAYRANDQCYALFGNDSRVPLAMGCTSDFGSSDLIALKRKLLLCDGDGCNINSSFPTSTGCVYCDSVTSPECATTPNASLTAVGCDDLPYTQCVTLVDEAGITRRGCFSDVDDDLFDECMNGQSGKCKICDENNCNNEVFPKDRRSCYRCDSTQDPDCEDSPQKYASICPLYKEDDRCLTKLEGPRTLRGCASELVCDPSDRSTCRICDSNNCNSINLLTSSVGEPGKWQDLPLNCYVCEGSECASDVGLIEQCEGNNLQNCGTIFGINGAVEKRGCSDSIQETHGDYCDGNPERCLACKSNGCNDAMSLDSYTDCYFCDSAEGANCSINFDLKARTRKCNGKCMVALYPRSDTDDPAYETIRSCLDDMDADDREKCESGEMKYCVTCQGARCNSQAYPEDRHECFRCSEPDCEDIEPAQCNAYHPNDQCYILYDNESSVADMGCRSQLEPAAVLALIKEKRLLLCDGKNCNTPDIAMPKSCLVCESADDSRCATNPNLIDNTQRCSSLPYTDCFTRVDEAGQTVRGCLSSLPSEDFYDCLTNSTGKCETCAKDNCNSIDIFPTDRLRCHQCDSSTNAACESSPDSNSVCPIYDPQGTCVTNLRNGITYRGCGSSMKCYDESDQRNCRKCSSSGCNTIDLVKLVEVGEPGKWQDVPLTCLHCSNEAECESSGAYNVCQGDKYQNCMTLFNANGRVAMRGCSDTVLANNTNYCESNPDSCLRCNSNGCNVANSLNDYIDCLVCDTDANDACVTSVSNVTRTRKCYKQCMTAMYPRDNEENPAYHLSRNCWDDMDLDDREACEAGTKEYCVACKTSRCNTVALPEKRLSCYSCEGDSCQLPEQKTCPYYRDNDQCYVLYDETRSVAGMGCLSKYTNAEADVLFRQKRLYLCSDDNCNDIENVPKSQKCTICNSRTDAACATRPETVTSNVTCNVAPFTECYSRVLSDGATERGCLSSLYDDEFVTCQSGNSTSCQTCQGDSCNTKVYPEDRPRCHICDSSSSPACEGKPNNVGICPLYNAEDTCLTVYRDGVTERGCSSSLTCDGTGSKGCSECKGDGCNTINLARRQDDNYGKWQDLPLRCYVCDGDECDSLSNAQVSTCMNNNEQDCMVLFSEEGKAMARGCEDDIEEKYQSYCDENADRCFNCKSNECNVAVSLTEFTECVYCDSYKDINCLWQPQNITKTRQCRGSCMTALYPSYSGSDPAYNVIRTCLSDKESSNQTSCANGRDENCKSCNTQRCNVDDLPANRLSCLYCANGDCEDPTPQKCPLYKKDDQCYIWFDSQNDIVDMGCLSSFGNQDLETIIKTKNVYICNEGDNCNTLDFVSSQKCAVCDSKTDVHCAINAKAILTFDECTKLPYTSCYSMLNTDGTTSRGCLTDLPEDDFAKCVLGQHENCEICRADGCNREIYPADRQQCYTCSSLDDSNCESFPSLMQPCPLVSDTESCKTALSVNETVRGCDSDILCDTTDSKTCRSCFGTSCNSIDLRNKIDDGYHGKWQDLPLSCHECHGEHCSASLGPVVTCSNNIEQDCATVFEANGTVRRRGCSDRVDDYEDLYCRTNPHLCFKCKSNECNIAWSVDEFIECAFCNSTENADCTLNPSNSQFPTRQCYKNCMVTIRSDDELIRSCLEDKEVFNQANCQGEQGKECASCSNGNCNRFVFPLDRLKCHVCTGSNCGSSEGKYCYKYNEDDFCFAKYENGAVDLMGCGSSQKQSDLIEWEQQNRLYRCNGNDCNDLAKLPSENQCVSCDSSRTPECAQNPGSFSGYETCEGPSNQCVTYINNAGHTLRSCLSALSQSEQDACSRNGTCAICTGDKCNNEIFPVGRRRCHICTSVGNENCEKSPNSLMICPEYTPNNRCVSQYKDNIVLRGCETDLTCDTSDTDRCQICDTDGCNTAELSGNSGTIISGSLLFTSILAYIAIRGLNIVFE